MKENIPCFGGKAFKIPVKQNNITLKIDSLLPFKNVSNIREFESWHF